jgi:zinc transport system substrate-binding protein
MKIDRKRAAGRLGRGLLAAVGLLMLVSLIGCTGRSAGQADAVGSTDPVKEPGRLKVVTTLFPYYDFVRQIAGDDVELTMIVPAGMDSHSFEPTPTDMRTMQAADLMICNGGAMETWVESVLDALDTSDMRVVTLMDYVDTYEEEIVEGMEDDDHDHVGHNHSGHSHNHDDHDAENCDDETHDHSHDDYDGHSSYHENHDDHDIHDDHDSQDHDGHEIEIEYDEHIWTSPVNAMTCVEVIRDTLCEMDPEHAAEYGQRAADYLDVLKDIDAGFREVSENRVRNLIVVGDKFPFRYLAEEYGLNYRAAFSGCSSDTEPSAQTIAYLIDKIRDEKIPVIYYLELSSHRVSDIIGEETGAEPLLLHSCHNVTRAEFERGITYEELMRQNIENLRAGID